MKLKQFLKGFGHADECYFDPQVESERKSLNTEGKYQGGGICVGCRHHTAGINCENCKEGYFRPLDVSQVKSKSLFLLTSLYHLHSFVCPKICLREYAATYLNICGTLFLMF